MLVGRGEDLALLLNLADLQGDEAVLDVGTAAGATALALAAKAGQVASVDMSERLIAAATDQAASQGLDNVAPEHDQLDEFVNSLEKLRDPDHARPHRLSEWLQFLGAAGLRVAAEPLRDATPEPLPDWMERLGVSPAVSAAITERLAGSPVSVREAFLIREDSFCLPRAAICAVK